MKMLRVTGTRNANGRLQDESVFLINPAHIISIRSQGGPAMIATTEVQENGQSLTIVTDETIDEVTALLAELDAPAKAAAVVDDANPAVVRKEL